MLTQNFTLQRVDEFLKILQKMITRNIRSISNVEYHEGRYDGNWDIFPVHGYWGKHDTWYRFRMRLEIPQIYQNANVRCRITTGRENAWNALNPQLLVYLNGKELQALDTNHNCFVIAANAVAGSCYEVELEAYSGREYDNLKFHEVPLRFEAEMYCHDDMSEQLYYDLYAARKAAELYPETNYDRIRIENYLTNALNLLDVRIPGNLDYEASVQNALMYIREEFYGKFCGSSEVIANCVAHTHIDVAWMWQLEQTRAKAVRSFTTELALMDEYPEHRFSSSQPQLYQFVKEDAPAVYERIKEKAAEGRWEIEGGMWLEADCNLISGESMIRQILYGKRFMKEEFGTESHILWLPDVFGYSAALPQILKKTGIDTFVTSKIHWNETNHFPYDTFLWKGIDGTEIFTQFILCGDVTAKLGDGNMFSTYVGQIMPSALAKGWELYQQKHLNHELLMTFGYGDGGGGVTREMLEMNRRLQYGIPGTPATRLSSIEEAIVRIKENVKEKKLPKWYGELYLEYHRGTYTSMAQNKKYNRTSEFLLQNVETLAVINKILNKIEYPTKELHEDWRILLLNQFHDIIPGSSIKEVYEDSEKQYEKLLKREFEQRNLFLKSLAECCRKKGIFVYNPIGIEQSGIVEIQGKKYFAESVPAYGWRVLETKESNESNELQISDFHMENRYYSITLDQTGALTSIFDKICQREVLSGRGNVLESYDDHPRAFDNWELCNYHKELMWELNHVEYMNYEQDEVSVSTVIYRRYLNSTIKQKITIYRDRDGIDFEINADWHEHHLFVKTAFPVDILSDKAAYEIQYGSVERPTHMNTSWDSARFEVCAHKWADYSETGYGVALLNDCKYGYDIHDGVMRLSLIKCGTYPNPEADQGLHVVRYSLIPHEGDWKNAGIVNRAYAFNCPLMAIETEGKGRLEETYSLIHASEKNIIITVVKESYDGDALIIRAYESQGKRTKTVITFAFSCHTVNEVDMLEQEIYDSVSTENGKMHIEFKPYEIKTFCIAKADH